MLALLSAMEGDTEIEVLYVATGSSLPSKRHIHYLPPACAVLRYRLCPENRQPRCFDPKNAARHTHTHQSVFGQRFCTDSGIKGHQIGDCRGSPEEGLWAQPVRVKCAIRLSPCVDFPSESGATYLSRGCCSCYEMWISKGDIFTPHMTGR